MSVSHTVQNNLVSNVKDLLKSLTPSQCLP